MTIREVSEKYGISEPTLRYYEKVGLIPPVVRKKGKRCYQKRDEEALNLALCMRQAGLPIESITRYMNLREEGESTARERLDILISERKSLQRKKTEIEEYIRRLDDQISLFKEEIVKKQA